jgi:hypothetical protein
MATFTCWCGHTIRENSTPGCVGRFIWDDTDRFYDDLAAAAKSYDEAKQNGAIGQSAHVVKEMRFAE